MVTKKGYWGTVYRTNISTAFNAGQAVESERLKKYILYERYNTVVGVHEICKALSDEVRERGGFGSVTPPNGYNCYSSIEPITKIEAEEFNIKPTPKNKRNPDNIKADEGFNNHPLKYLYELPKSVVNRLPSGNTIKKIIKG